MSINKSGIYEIKNKINGKVYIGKASNIKKRWNHHIEKLESNSHHNKKLQEDFNKYGLNNFEFSIVKVTKFLDRWESKIAHERDAFNKGYNIAKLMKYELISLSKSKTICKNIIRYLEENLKPTSSTRYLIHINDISNKTGYDKKETHLSLKEWIPVISKSDDKCFNYSSNILEVVIYV